RRFQTVMIDQLTVENTINILRCLKQRYEVHHGVRIQDSALVAATILSNHYITDRFLPIKAIDLVDEAASRRRIELDSVPVEIDAVYGRIRMLMIEREALRRETDPASRERQAKVEQEIANLNEQLHSLQLALEREREPIEKIRLLKKELEQAQVNYDKAEYERDFGKMAELHYGIIPDLERRIQDMESKLISIQGTRMLKAEVDSEDIAEIISKLTHIPVSMLMREDEEQKKPEIGENTLTVSKGSIEIFFCYAHEDELLLKKLETQLAALKRQGWIKLWYDRYISPGTEWKTEIDEHLNRAQIILLLISPDFMNSDYCYGIEMKRALERHNCGEAWVIPIILRPVYWKVEPLSTLQALPTDAIPVTAGSWHSLDDAFFNVNQGIRKVIKEMTKNSDV
ncbi:MAG: TIR domain-containing protein, partial [Ktedonobacteraceae bacterium]